MRQLLTLPIGRLLAGLRRFQTHLLTLGKSAYLTRGPDLHLGRGTRLWAPERLVIGNCVYIGKDVHIEANCSIGDYCLIANRVAIIGRHDHDYTAVGYPIRFAPWIGSQRASSRWANENVEIGSDVWLGYGAIVLTGVKIGRGSVIAAGSVVANDVPPYSIAAGVPAKVVGRRFPDDATIVRHERSIRNGTFRLSEIGYDACIIEPKIDQS